MDRNVLANSTNIVKYIAVSNCLSCDSAAVSNPCSSKGQQNLIYAYVLVGPTYHPEILEENGYFSKMFYISWFALKWQ